MKKYLRLTCTLCRRDIDKLVNIKHYTPDRCTITQGCEGRLQPVEYRSSAGIAVSPEVGVVDWQQRGSKKIASTQVTNPELISLLTGSLKQLVLAAPVDQAEFKMVFLAVADTPKAYRQYIFRREGVFSTISGVESGLEKKALRFTAYGPTPDVVEVHVNGVKKDPNVDYEIADGTTSSGAPPNTIVFKNEIDASGVTQVDVIVSKEQTATSYELTFKRNSSDESRLKTGAFENVDCVDGIFNDEAQRLYLYTLDLDTIEVPLNTILIPADTSVNAMLLLARRPYTQLDRYTDLVVDLRQMDIERDFIKYYAEDGVTTAKATVTTLLSLFPPLRLGKFNVEKPLTVATAGVEEQLVIDGKVITGPDA